MDQSLTPTARIIAAVIGLTSLATLALQTAINTAPDASHLVHFGLTLRFFTIWSNLAAGLVLLWIGLGRKVDGRIPFALTTALTIVALVYHALLAADHHPQGLDWWTNLNFHTLIPLAVAIWWVAFSGRAQLTWRSLPWVMVFPIIYTIFALAYGAVSGFYAYFFLDLPALGWGQLLVNMLGLSAFFVAMGTVLLTVRRIAHRGKLTGHR